MPIVTSSNHVEGLYLKQGHGNIGCRREERGKGEEMREGGKGETLSSGRSRS